MSLVLGGIAVIHSHANVYSLWLMSSMREEVVRNSLHGFGLAEGRPLRILSGSGESGSRTHTAGKVSAVNGSGENTTVADSREGHKREYKRKQLLIAREKDKEPAVVSINGTSKAMLFV